MGSNEMELGWGRFQNNVDEIICFDGGNLVLGSSEALASVFLVIQQ